MMLDPSAVDLLSSQCFLQLLLMVPPVQHQPVTVVAAQEELLCFAISNLIRLKVSQHSTNFIPILFLFFLADVKLSE